MTVKHEEHFLHLHGFLYIVLRCYLIFKKFQCPILASFDHLDASWPVDLMLVGRRLKPSACPHATLFLWSLKYVAHDNTYQNRDKKVMTTSYGVPKTLFNMFKPKIHFEDNTFHLHLYFSKRYKFIKWLRRTWVLHSLLWRTRVLHSCLSLSQPFWVCRSRFQSVTAIWVCRSHFKYGTATWQSIAIGELHQQSTNINI